MSGKQSSVVTITVISEPKGEHEQVSVQMSMPPFKPQDGITAAQRLGFQFLEWLEEQTRKRDGRIGKNVEARKVN